MTVQLPKQLEAWRQGLEQTARPVIRIQTKREQPSRTQSHFGGTPYWLKTMPYPTAQDGTPLRLLAQIRFDEIERPLPYYPTTGLLQFFIASDDLYGLDFDAPQKQDTFRVVYHEMVEEDETKWADIPHIPVEEYGFPMEEAGTLQFVQEEMYLSCDDFRFTEQYDWTALDLGDEEDEVLDELWENISSSGHQLGGYPYFTQEDPRAYSDDVLKEYELLFQLDTDDTIECMWGDAGVANFFIHPDDLKNRDFSNVLYNWDCH